MNPDISKWIEQAEKDVHWERERSVWQARFLDVVKELERANKIIDKILE